MPCLSWLQKNGIAQFSIKGKGMLSYVGVTPFPMGVNTTYVAGLASYSVCSEALVHPSRSGGKRRNKDQSNSRNKEGRRRNKRN